MSDQEPDPEVSFTGGLVIQAEGIVTYPDGTVPHDDEGA